MWSSIRHYRGGTGRDDDITLSCTCITDWCFIWCSNQCSKKTGPHSSESSQLTNELDESTDYSCCKVNGCSPRTLQVQSQMENVSQVLQVDQEGEAEETDHAGAASPCENDNPRLEDLEVGRWSNLRKFRPRLFNPGRTSVGGVPSQDASSEEKPSRFRRMSSWFRNLYQRQDVGGSSAVSPSKITADEVTGQACEGTEVEHVHDSEDYKSPWGDQFIVFSRSSCGYESFHPNCCRLHQTMMYALQKTVSYETGLTSQAQEFEQETITQQYQKTDEMYKKDDGEPPNFLTDPLGNIAAAAITMVTASVDPKEAWNLESPRKDVSISKLTRVHTSEPQDYYQELTGIHTHDASRGTGSFVLFPNERRHAVVPVERSARTEANVVYRSIPKVIITGTSSPIRHISDDYDYVDQPKATNTDSQDSNKCPSEDSDIFSSFEDESTQKDIVNYMINMSPQRPGTRASGDGADDGRKKTVRFKDTTSVQPAKGRAVYVGTFKHACAFQTEVIECIPTGTNKRIVSEGRPCESSTNVQEDSFVNDSVDSSALVNPQNKRVNEYANEYSELCKASVDQEREILQNVIDSVRECFQTQTSLETKTCPKKHS